MRMNANFYQLRLARIARSVKIAVLVDWDGADVL